MNQDQPQFNDLRGVSASDHFIDWHTWKRIVDYFKSRGFGAEASIPDIFASLDTIMDQTFARLGLRVRTENAAGDIPDDTSVYMYNGVEVLWDSSTNTWIDVDGGLVWNGGAAGSEFDQNLLRLIGQPGFGNGVTEYGPLLLGAIVPIFRVNEDAFYAAASENGTEITLDDFIWCFSYMGEDPVVHPFKCRLNADDPMTIDVGYMRDFDTNAGDGDDVADISHTGADFISIMQSGGDAQVIELNAVDEVDVDGGATEGFIYYEVDTDAADAEAKFSDVWPPDPDPQKHIFLVCKVKVATIDAVEQVFTIGQHQFSQVTIDSEGPEFKVRRSLQIVNGFAQFLLDLKVGQLGQVFNSVAAFAGFDVGGIGRTWRAFYNPANLNFSILNPQDDGDEAKTGTNERHIGMTNINLTQGVNIRHRNIAESDLDDHIIDTIYGVTAATFAALAAPGTVITKADLTEYVIDDNHHLFREGESYDEDPYDPFVDNGGLAAISFAGRAVSGTLFNDQMDQEVQTVEADGVTNTTIYDSPINFFLYTAFNTAGDPIEMNTAGLNATKETAIQTDIDEYDAAPKNGNDDVLSMNLARFGFNTQITLQTAFEETPFSVVFQDVDGENDMTSDAAFSGDIDDGVEFTVVVTLEKLAVAYTRIDGLGEYRGRFTYTYDNDDPINVGGIGVGNNVILVNSGDAGWPAGGIITATQTPVIDPLQLNSEAHVLFELEWYANPNAVPANMFGITNYPTATDEVDIVGSTSYTNSVAAGSIDSPVASFQSANTSGVLDTPINIEYEILDAAAATTDYSDAMDSATVQLFKVGEALALDVTMKFGAQAEQETTLFIEDIINPTTSNATDGLLFQLLGFADESDIMNGEYRVEVEVAGIALAEYTFELMGEGGIFCWSDFMDTESTDEPFPDGDFDNQPVEQSINTTAPPFTLRFTPSNSDGTSSIVAGDLFLELPARSVSSDKIEGYTLDHILKGDFDIEIDVDWTNLDVSLDANEFVQLLLSLDIGGSGWTVVVGKFPPGHGYLPNQTGYDFQDAVTDAVGAAAPAGNDTLRLVRVGSAITGYFNAVSQVMDTGSGDATVLIRMFQFGSSANIPAIDTTISDFGVQVKDKSDSLIDFYRLNFDRWTVLDTLAARQVVDVVSNTLQHFCTPSTVEEAYLRINAPSSFSLLIGYEKDGSGFRIFGDADGASLFTSARTSVGKVRLTREDTGGGVFRVLYQEDAGAGFVTLHTFDLDAVSSNDIQDASIITSTGANLTESLNDFGGVSTITSSTWAFELSLGDDNFNGSGDFFQVYNYLSIEAPTNTPYCTDPP